MTQLRLAAAIIFGIAGIAWALTLIYFFPPLNHAAVFVTVTGVAASAFVCSFLAYRDAIRMKGEAVKSTTRFGLIARGVVAGSIKCFGAVLVGLSISLLYVIRLMIDDRMNTDGEAFFSLPALLLFGPVFGLLSSITLLPFLAVAGAGFFEYAVRSRQHTVDSHSRTQDLDSNAG